MTGDVVAELLAEALRDLVRFVDERPDDATADDDVRALESVAHVLHQVTPEDRPRMRALLGSEFAASLGWT
ncbi:hypothetical protein GCM10029976_053420 [Kribbella albertanoniae]|uniref:Uncharacterized protein n=1 Tax=Kribbella albertanoniae TaxID=1266829 RepID=A0A4R4PSL1_9ACTN|nr:hypothetical protein [Kribbella albertanoniae]TDC25322.1 hypothetical protein E1261_24440 [Kribbella albertanoniae]